MKKAIIFVVILAVMMMCGGVAYAEVEVDPLVEDLRNEGFVQDKTNEYLWTYEDTYVDWDGLTIYCRAWFDTNENIGAVIAMSLDSNGKMVESCSYTVRWNSDVEDYEILTEFEDLT